MSGGNDGSKGFKELDEKALAAFMEKQSQLRVLDVNERALGAVLAYLYVRDVSSDHTIDAGYN